MAGSRPSGPDGQVGTASQTGSFLKMGNRVAGLYYAIMLVAIESQVNKKTVMVTSHVINSFVVGLTCTAHHLDDILTNKYGTRDDKAQSDKVQSYTEFISK